MPRDLSLDKLAAIHYINDSEFAELMPEIFTGLIPDILVTTKMEEFKVRYLVVVTNKMLMKDCTGKEVTTQAICMGTVVCNYSVI